MDTVKDSIVEGAFKAFVKYGFKQTSMALIAEEAQLSRQAVYNHFANKEEVLVAVADTLQTRATVRSDEVMAQALANKEEIVAATTRIFDARFEVFLGPLSDSPHFQELISVNSHQQHCAGMNTKFLNEFTKKLGRFLKDLSEARNQNFVKGLSPDELARLMVDSIHGLKHSITEMSPKSFRTRVGLTITLLISGAIEK